MPRLLDPPSRSAWRIPKPFIVSVQEFLGKRASKFLLQETSTCVDNQTLDLDLINPNRLCGLQHQVTANRWWCICIGKNKLHRDNHRHTLSAALLHNVPQTFCPLL